MTMPATNVARPGTVEEAVRILADSGPAAMIIAGGTDVVPNLQMKLFSPGVLVDLKPIRALRGITLANAGALRIGALTTLTEIVESPLVRANYQVLASAVSTIAGPLQRNMGTLGGNLCLETRCLWYNQSYFWRKALGYCLKKDGDICHVAPGGKRCWAAWSGDSAPALLTLEAEIEIVGPRSTRRLPLADFYLNDGMKRIALGSDELVSAVYVPTRTAGRRGAYHKLRIRDSIDYPLAGVAVALDVDRSGMCLEARLAITAVNPAPLLVKEAGEWMVGQRYSPELIGRVAHAAIRTGKPLTTSASTPVYRRDMVRLFTRRALEEAWQGRNGQPSPRPAD
jgi:4-hydroxybenzoyl-CoA reductase subunit beta